MVIINLPENGAYAKYEGLNVDEEAMKAFVSASKAGTLKMEHLQR